ncbi:hypothetical protein JXA80_02455, partial [bacterium]|nr:hypothetical protein [candidate division CSSED10-310 bacterium]
YQWYRVDDFQVLRRKPQYWLSLLDHEAVDVVSLRGKCHVTSRTDGEMATGFLIQTHSGEVVFQTPAGESELISTTVRIESVSTGPVACEVSIIADGISLGRGVFNHPSQVMTIVSRLPETQEDIRRVAMRVQWMDASVGSIAWIEPSIFPEHPQSVVVDRYCTSL